MSTVSIRIDASLADAARVAFWVALALTRKRFSR